MSDEQAVVESFFRRYEAANAVFDVEQIAGCYADVFMFGRPEGVQAVKKEDFLKVLPRRKEYFRAQGLVASHADSLEVSVLDSKYTLVRVRWNMSFERNGQKLSSQNAASYVLAKAEDRLEIVFQIDHQDLAKRAAELTTG
jgi:hypothetical protein